MSEAPDISRDRDRFLMRQTLLAAEQQLGEVWPNPSVGCLIVDDDGAVVARGATQRGGRPHAEAVALRAAAGRARGATAYVSLEPCDHWGKTPPCSGSLVAAGVQRVVVAVEDPDPRTNGGGIRSLRQAGVEVIVGVGRQRALELNAGFFKRISRGRPLIAATGDEARVTELDGVPLRCFDAALAGPKTLRESAELAALPPSRPRLLLAPLPPDDTTARWLAAQPWPAWVVLASRDAARGAHLRALGVDEIVLVDDEQTLAAAAGLVSIDAPPPEGLNNPHPVLAALGDMGLTRVAVDGASRTARWLSDANLLDRRVSAE